ncbi:MAG: CCA tRNA nucleotidyltransferase, partial [Synergistaceae bacterium]|nr:CCA tRNA nucleotidyltransferase [Synergistaceae bacterium]
MIKDKLSRSCDVLRLFRENGFEAYIVGGTVRDLILGSRFTDVDIATSAQPKDVMDIFPEAKIVGNEPFCTLVIPQEGWTIEVTPFQGDTLFADLSRRDFTINAMAMNFVGELIDPFGGLQDITKRIIRFTGSPGDRIKEDPIRCIRLFRFASTLKGFSIDGPSMEEAKESLPLFENIP